MRVSPPRGRRAEAEWTMGKQHAPPRVSVLTTIHALDSLAETTRQVVFKPRSRLRPALIHTLVCPTALTMVDATPTTQSTDTGSGPRENGGVGGPKAIIKNVDMVEEMQQESIDVASAAIDKYSIEKDIAAQIKKEFDKRHGATWHVVVGKNFGSYVTHGTSLSFAFCLVQARLTRIVPETKHFIYFYIGALAILIWKS